MKQPSNPNRIRKQLSTTIDIDILWVIKALSEGKARGFIIEEVFADWLTQCAYFDIPKVGPVRLHEDVLYYSWVDMNNEVQSPNFRTFKEALTWLKKTYPETNYNLNIEES